MYLTEKNGMLFCNEENKFIRGGDYVADYANREKGEERFDKLLGLRTNEYFKPGAQIFIRIGPQTRGCYDFDERRLDIVREVLSIPYKVFDSVYKEVENKRSKYYEDIEKIESETNAIIERAEKAAERLTNRLKEPHSLEEMVSKKIRELKISKEISIKKTSEKSFDLIYRKGEIKVPYEKIRLSCTKREKTYKPKNRWINYF